MIATDAVFAEAVGVIDPLVVPTNGLQLVSRLEKCRQPEKHPQGTLRLLDLLVVPNAFAFGGDQLRRVLARIDAGRAGTS